MTPCHNKFEFCKSHNSWHYFLVWIDNWKKKLDNKGFYSVLLNYPMVYKFLIVKPYAYGFNQTTWKILFKGIHERNQPTSQMKLQNY